MTANLLFSGEKAYQKSHIRDHMKNTHNTSSSSMDIIQCVKEVKSTRPYVHQTETKHLIPANNQTTSKLLHRSSYLKLVVM